MKEIEKPVVLGIDIGGSHITAALVDLATGALIWDSMKRSAVDPNQEATTILAAWCEIIEQVFDKSNTEKYLGIAMPGPFDYENGISLIKDQNKFNSLYQINIKEELAQCLAIRPSKIRFINDAAGFMQGEVFSGAAKGYDQALGLTLGTGLGAAIAVNGIAKDAELWNASFLDGIAEDYLSTRWFMEQYQNLSGKTITGVKELVAIVDTDGYAKQLFSEFGSNLGNFLAPIIQKHDSEIVVLGGNIAQSFSLFSTELMNRLAAHALTTTLKTSTLNEHAALIGAASTWDLVDIAKQKI